MAGDFGVSIYVQERGTLCFALVLLILVDRLFEYGIRSNHSCALP